MMSGDDLTRFKHDIMVVLAAADAKGGTHGLGVKKHLEAHYGEEVNHGRLYPNLDDLVDRGLVSKRALDDRTNTYALTTDGVALLEDRMSWLYDSVSKSFDVEVNESHEVRFREQ